MTARPKILKKPVTPPQPGRIYAKAPIEPEAALQRLWDRGLRIDDRLANLRALRSIGYYRLLIFMRRFQSSATKNFLPNTKFSHIVELYEFDRRLRAITMSAIERIEVSLRTALSNSLATHDGSHWYLERGLFATISRYSEVLALIAKACKDKRGPSLTHYLETYAEPELPPAWLVFERLTLGALSRTLDALNSASRKRVTRYHWAKFNDTVIVSWLRSLTDLRNACAHHTRLWHMKLTVSQPAQPVTVSVIHYGDEMKQSTTFYSRAVMIKALLDPLEHGAEWRDELAKALLTCRHVEPLIHLGFPPDWRTRRAWE
ncbi:Abi family protein [Pandoraea sp. ISTKB]|uniref:Abi family protein n=1 Tax=Pandoraea sp. ISTKB TaxID=1586708 RepID=UPI0008470D54|nr:Abi family protein [Pandoraea sp. ISTKB]ODP35702.1 DNA-binding protein [Pandoraea sp. ISTKB]